MHIEKIADLVTWGNGAKVALLAGIIAAGKLTVDHIRKDVLPNRRPARPVTHSPEVLESQRECRKLMNELNIR